MTMFDYRWEASLPRIIREAKERGTFVPNEITITPAVSESDAAALDKDLAAVRESERQRLVVGKDYRSACGQKWSVFDYCLERGGAEAFSARNERGDVLIYSPYGKVIGVNGTDHDLVSLWDRVDLSSAAIGSEWKRRDGLKAILLTKLGHGKWPYNFKIINLKLEWTNTTTRYGRAGMKIQIDDQADIIGPWVPA